MNDKSENIKKAESVAKDILMLSRNILLVNLRFLDMSINRLTWQPDPFLTFATNGDKLFYNPMFVLNLYREEQSVVARDYLHIIFHCVFQHMFVDVNIDHDYWDLACDIAVENAINELNIKSVESSRMTKQGEVISQLKKSIKQLTAEKIYRYFKDLNIGVDEINNIRNLFIADDHSIWYFSSDNPVLSVQQKNDEDNHDDDNKNNSKKSDSSEKHYDNGEGQQHSQKNGNDNDQQQMNQNTLEQEWKDIAARMQTEMETFSRQQGDMAGGLSQNLLAVNREKYDYTSFLKKFAVMGEAMKINDDDFDYIFYTYGLNLYKNMPLIEPLEYKEVKRIKEFVVAIDTSGSTSGELVQRFIQKTYNILKSTESFFTKINVHIIQCDAEIQEDVKITNQEEFDEYLKHMKIHGLGGTDFRPVFSYVDELLKKGEFIHLKGLIYFTDGYGVFPEHKPDYDTAVVYIDDNYNNPDVPPWTIKLVLQSDEI